MKKYAVLMIVVATAAFLLSPIRVVGSDDDLQAIKKAVRENPRHNPGKEVTFFKILVIDHKTGKETVKISLPILVIDVFSHCANNNHPRMHKRDCAIDVAALFQELKAIGPQAILEITHEDRTVKVWFE
jgi:hypothetical protein